MKDERERGGGEKAKGYKYVRCEITEHQYLLPILWSGSPKWKKLQNLTEEESRGGDVCRM